MTTVNPVIRSRILDIARRHTDVLFPDRLADELIAAVIPPQEPKTRIERLHDEFNTLEGKHKALRLFMQTDAFRSLDRREKLLMDQQSRAMNMLLSAYRMRLDFYGVYV